MSDAPQKKVLVADDSRFFRALMSYALEEEGYGCESVASGDELFERLQAGEVPDLLVLDLVMPGMNGFQVLDKLRSLDACESLPVLVISQHGLNTLESEILKNHAVLGTLPKASSIERLLFEIRNALFPADSDGRRAPRVPFSMAVTARTQADTQLTTTFNVSENGMFLVLADREPPLMDEPVMLKFWVPGAGRIFEMGARVVWTNAADDTMRRTHPPGFAVEFVDPDPDTLAAIAEFVDTQA